MVHRADWFLGGPVNNSQQHGRGKIEKFVFKQKSYTLQQATNPPTFDPPPPPPFSTPKILPILKSQDTH